MSKYVVNKEKEHFRALSEDLNTTWNQGYISALANYEIITEEEFDELMEFMQPGWVEYHATMINKIVEEIKCKYPQSLTTRTLKKVLKTLTIFKY